MLFARGHSGLRVVVMGKTDEMNNWRTLAYNFIDPRLTNAKIAVAAKPISINPAKFTRGNNLNSLSSSIEVSNSQKEAKTRKGTD